MISRDQKKKLKIFLKNDYIKDVLSLLKKRGITRNDGEHYSETTIRSILNGHRENIDIENALIQVYIARKEQHEARQRKIKELLE